MTEDVSAGRLVAEVVSDTTGFARDAKKKIDAEVRAIKARIKAEIDTKGLATQAKVAAREASQAAVVRLKVQLDTKGLIGQARAAAVLASSAATVKLKAEIDTRGLAAQAKAAAAASTASAVSVPVGADTAKAEGEVEAFKQRTKRDGVSIPVRVDGKGLSAAASGLKGLSLAPAIAGGVFLLGTAIVQLGGGLIAVTSAASQAVGTLAIIPNLAGIAAQGVAALFIGLNGVGSALGAMGKAEAATTAATASGGAQATATARAIQSAARQRTRAAQAVKDAQVGLKDAQQAADDQAISGARAVADARRALADARTEAVDRQRAAIETVSDAEWTLARAQESAVAAQKDLTAARIDAKQHIDDLNAALKSGVLDEKAAMLAVEKAKQNLQDTNWNVMSSDLDKKNADLAVKQAEDALGKIQSANKKTAVSAAKANKDGVEGSDQVKNARDGVRDALHAEQEDTENLANAQREAAKTQIDSARNIELALRAVGDAVKQNKDGEVAAARAIEQAQRGVVDAKQNYVDAQQAVKDANESAAAGGTKAAAAQTALAAAMAKLSPAGRKFVKFIYGLKPQWIGLRNAVQEALLPPIQRGVTAALPLLKTLQGGLVDSATIAGGLGESLGKALGEKSFNKDVGTIMDSNNRAMQSFGDAGLNVVQILRHIAVAAGPLVERFAAWTEKLTAGWAEEVKVGRETGKLQVWLGKAGDTAALLGSIIGHLVGALFGMGKAAAPAGQELLATFDKISKKWDTFANSDEGQKQMKAFFDATKPVTEELGKLVVNLVDFITKAGAGGGGSLNGFLQTLNFILGALNKFMSIPGVAPVIGALLTMAGVGGALGLVAASVLKIGKNLGKLKKFTGLQSLIDKVKGAKDAIDDELPKDKAKTKALDGLDGSAKKTGKSLGGKFVAGVKAASGAVVTGAKALGGWVVSMAKMGAATAATTVKMLAQRAAAVAVRLAALAARAASIAWTAVQWLLNVAMDANPIGAIVLGIGLLIGAFILAWKHSELFRKIVTGALNGLKVAALAVFHAVGDAVQWVIGFVGDHWKLLLGILGGPFVAALVLIITHWSQIKAVFWAAVTWVVGAFAKAWAGVKKIFTDPIGAAKTAIVALLGATGLLKPFNAVWGWVKNIFSKAWSAVKKIFTDPIGAAKTALDTMLGATGLRKPFNAVWGWIKSTFSTAWAGLKKIFTDPIGAAKIVLDQILGKLGLRKTFSDAVGAITKIWDGLKAAAKTPIKFIIDTVLNSGLIDGFNWIADKVGVKTTIPHIPLPKGFEDGGQIPGRPSSKDNLVARGPMGQQIGLATGEFITNAKETAKNLPLLKAINAGKIRLNSAVQTGFADGGIFGKVKDGIGNLVSKGKDLGGDVLDVLKDPLAWFKKRMAAPLDRMKELGTSPYAETVKKVPRMAVDLVGNKAKEILSGLGIGSDPGAAAVGPGITGGRNGAYGGVKPWVAAAGDLIRNMFHVGSIGGVGGRPNKSDHPLGLALDFMVGKDKAKGNAIAAYMMKMRNQLRLTYLIWYDRIASASHGWKWRPYTHPNGPTSNPTLRHEDHVHASFMANVPGFAKGGLFGGDMFDVGSGRDRVPNTEELVKSLGITFDTGGWLGHGKNGRTVVDNKSGMDEAVLNHNAWTGASSVLSRIAAIATQMRTGEAAAGGEAPLVGSLSLTVGDKRDIPEALDEVDHRLRVIKRGGVYASRT